MVDGKFNSFAADFGEFLTIIGATFENFDTVVGVGVMGSGNVDCKIELHFIKTIINGRSGKDAGSGIFYAIGFAGFCEVINDPFRRFAGVASDEDFDVVAFVVNKATNDADEKLWCKIVSWFSDAIGTKVFHDFLS